MNYSPIIPNQVKKGAKKADELQRAFSYLYHNAPHVLGIRKQKYYRIDETGKMLEADKVQTNKAATKNKLHHTFDKAVDTAAAHMADFIDDDILSNVLKDFKKGGEDMGNETIWEVAVIETPTLRAQEDGAEAKMILPPTPVLALSKDAAIGIACKGLDMNSRMRVLVVPFGG